MRESILLLVQCRHHRFAYLADDLPVTIGSDPEWAACAIDSDPSIAPRHVNLDLSDGELLAYDEGEDGRANGTVVDGEALAPGAWIPIGPAAHTMRMGQSTIIAQAATDEVVRQVQGDGRYQFRGMQPAALPRSARRMPFIPDTPEIRQAIEKLDDWFRRSREKRFDGTPPC